MQVETFEVDAGVAEQTPNEHSEALALVEELSLAGQKGLYNPSPEIGACTFREMTVEEAFVYGTLCPVHTPVDTYSSDTIPLRVLEILRQAKRLDIFTDFLVWHRAGVAVKDPVLVASKPAAPDRTWDVRRYILARWGEHLDEWPSLVKKALDQFREKAAASLRAAIAHYTSDLTRVEDPNLSLGEAASFDAPPSIYGFRA